MVAPPQRATLVLEHISATDEVAMDDKGGDHKLIVDLDNGDQRLFDLSADPDERVDLSATEPTRLAILQQLLDAWAEESQLAEPSAELDLTEEERKRLKALGYL